MSQRETLKWPISYHIVAYIIRLDNRWRKSQIAQLGLISQLTVKVKA